MDLSYDPVTKRSARRSAPSSRAARTGRRPASIGLAEGGPVEPRAGRRCWSSTATRRAPCRKEYGGFGAKPDLLENIIIDEEFRRAGVPRGMANQGISMLVPTLLQYGTEEQKRRYIGPTIRGEMIWCQGYSEPGSGSDLAASRPRPSSTATSSSINGQKIWTSTAHDADMMFALVRTEPDAPQARRHQLPADRHEDAGHHGAPARDDDRRRRLQRGLLRQRARAAREPGRQARPGLGGGQRDAHPRAQHARRRRPDRDRLPRLRATCCASSACSTTASTATA